MHNSERSHNHNNFDAGDSALQYPASNMTPFADAPATRWGIHLKIKEYSSSKVEMT
jgi:hypothetical protein